MNNTLCSAAWLDMNIDFGNKTLSHCCKTEKEPFPANLTEDFFNNSEHIIKLRKDLLGGVENSACNHCWLSYKNTNSAYRDFKNKWKNANDIVQTIENIEITLDNVCDMACIYCDLSNSSRIAQEVGHTPVMTVPNQEHIQTFINWFEGNCKKQPFNSLSFLGGEISYSKNFYKFMELVLEKKSLHETKINFSVLTNGNATEKNQKKLLNLFDSLPDKWGISLGISNEAVGEITELVRYGVSWKRFSSNFIDYINHPRIVNVTLAPTPSIFTVSRMHEYFTWCINELRKTNTKLAIFGNWVNWPEVLDPARLDESYKKHVRKTKKLIEKNKNIFIDNSQHSHTITWLEQLENRINTMPFNEYDLDQWLLMMSKQKKDEKILTLKEHI